MPKPLLLTSSCLLLLSLGLATPSARAASTSDPGALAFTTDQDGDSEVYVIALEDGSEENLTLHPANDGSPKWSSFGTRMAFVSDRDGVSSLYVIPLDGTDPVRVSEIDNLDWSWSPDGRRIAWVQHSGWKDLWVTDVETGSTIKLTNGTREVWGPSWSPDGRSIMFESHDGGFFDIYRIPAEGGTAVNLTANQTGNNLQPQWSPDGTQIAFAFRGADSASLYVMGTDGTSPRFLTEFQADGCGSDLGGIAWSPDGSKLAYATISSCGGRAEIFDFFVIDEAGGTPTALGVSGKTGGPSWSPDGSRIAVETGDNSSDFIWLVDADGGNPVNLTALVGSGQTRSPSWSPDGSRLAFEADPDPQEGALPTPPNSDIYVADADGGNPVNLVAGTAPDWKPAAKRGVGLVDPARALWHLEDQTAFYFGISGDAPVLGDWNCDGIETPGVFRPSSASAYLRNSLDTGVADSSFFFGVQGDIPLAGDWDGDGCDSLGVYRPGVGKVFLRNTLDTGFADIEYFLGIAGDRPFVGDFDADGVDEIGLYRQSSGLTYLKMDHNTGAADVEFFYGTSDDYIIAGDWNGDGMDTVGVFRPADHKFYLRNENSPGLPDHEFWMGHPTWIPVAGS